jgi:hypothetical protein
MPLRLFNASLAQALVPRFPELVQLILTGLPDPVCEVDFGDFHEALSYIDWLRAGGWGPAWEEEW